MVGSNLPDDVTPGDIDDHFGPPETKTIHGTVMVATSVETQFFDSEREMSRELMKAVRKVLTDGNGDLKGDVVQVLDADVEEIE